MGAEVLPGEQTPVGMRQGGATTAQEPRLALVARSEAMHGWRVFRIASASLWGHRGSKRGQTRAVRSENARDYGTEVGRAGAASPPVWPVHSRGALVAHAWLCSFDLSKFDECTNLAPSSIRKRWTVWFMTSRLVAERVSFGTGGQRHYREQPTETCRWTWDSLPANVSCWVILYKRT